MKLETIIDHLTVAIVIIVLIIVLYRNSFFLTSGVLAASVMAPVLSVRLASYGLRKRGMGLERFLIGLATSVSGIWLYEFLYHYSYYVDGSLPFSALLSNLLTFNIDTGMSTYFPLPWALIMISLMFVGYRYMRLNKWFGIVSIFSIVFFGIWIGIGYPQWVFSGYQWLPINPVISTNLNLSTFYAYLFNSLTKLSVVIAPSTLYLNRSHNTILVHSISE